MTSSCEPEDPSEQSTSIGEIGSTDYDSDGSTVIGEKNAENHDDENDDAELEEDGGWATSDDEFEDPEHTSVEAAPGKNELEETKLQVAEFQRRWAERKLDQYTPEQQDKYLIKHARRWGMSVAAIARTGWIQTGREDAIGITYRIQKLKGQGKDVNPRTAQAAWQRNRKEQSNLTPKVLETSELMRAIKNGMTVQEIVEAEIVTKGVNTPKAIRHRWDTYIRRGCTLPSIR